MPAARGHGSGSARKRRSSAHAGGEEEGGSERWLVTYADMLTLLLVLFIVLFSVSVVNTSKYISLKTSLASVFGDGRPGVMDGGNGLLQNDASGTGQQAVMPGMPVAAAAGSTAKSNTLSYQLNGNAATTRELQAMQAGQAAADQKANFEQVRAVLQKALQRAGLSNDVRFAITARGLVITVVTDALVFPGNSAQLLGQGQRILRIITPPLTRQTRPIEVDGYTNQAKVSTYPYPSGWELSSARAAAVVRFLAAHGVAEGRLTAVGYSDQHPLYPASDPRSVTLNRRVEIVVLAAQATGAGSNR